MSASGIATRETIRSRQMGTNKPVTTQRCEVDPKKWYPFSQYMGLPSSAYNVGCSTQYNARQVLYQKDVFSILDQSYPFHEMGVYLESLGTGLPKLQSDNFLPGGMGTVPYNPRNFPQQQTCAHSAQLTLQGHMLDHRQICVN